MALDPFVSPTNNIPINVTKVENLMQASFREANTHVGTTVILVELENI